MKQILLLIFGGVFTTLLSWISTLSYVKATYFIEIVKVLFLIGVFFIQSLGFFNVFNNRRTDGNLDKTGLGILLFGTVLVFLLLIAAVGWFFRTMPVTGIDKILTHYHHVLEILVGLYFILCCQYISVKDVGKSAIPGIDIEHVKLIGHILVDLGVDEKLIEKALKKQKELSLKNSKIGGSDAQ